MVNDDDRGITLHPGVFNRQDNRLLFRLWKDKR
jgi:hypothetical protein